MSANTPENKVKAKLRALLKDLNVYSLPVQSAGLGEAGHPDRIACLCGHLVGIECKATAKQKPTALQEKRLTDIRASGGMTFVVDADNFDEFEVLLRALHKARPGGQWSKWTTEAAKRGSLAYWR